MSLINNDRDMQNFLCDLRSPGEFSQKDLGEIALALPISHLAAALYAHSGREPFTRADTHDKKADLVARLLHAWCLSPDLRFGQLVGNLSCNQAFGKYSGPDDCDPFFIEDGVLAERADAAAGVVTLKARRGYTPPTE